MKHSQILGGALALLVASVASAQWTENFDSYPVGPLNVNGWDGWDGTPSAYGIVTTDMSRSAPNSLQANGTVDAVYNFNGAYTSGQWTFTGWVYIPGDMDDITYWIIQNEYVHGGPYDWTVEVAMDPIGGEVIEDIQDFYGNGSNLLTLVTDQWVEIRSDFDFDNNVVTTYYNNELLATGDINIRTGGAIEAANLDIFGPQTGPAYYDDITVAVTGGNCYADFNGDGSVNTQDFIAYLGAWAAGDMAADCNGDSTINTQDFICFLGLWAAGC